MKNLISILGSTLCMCLLFVSFLVFIPGVIFSSIIRRDKNQSLI